MSVWILADILIISVIAFLGYMSMKRGFLKSSYGGIASFAALLLVFSFHTPFQNYLENSFIGDTVKEKIKLSVETSLYANPDIDTTSPDKGTAEQVIESLNMPDFMTDWLYDSLNNQQDNYNGLKENLIDGVTGLIYPIVMQILSVFLLYLIIRIILWGIFLALRLIVEFPVFGAIDKILGIVVGAVNALLIIYVASALIMLLIPVNSPGIESDINSTFIFKYFYYNNLLTNLFF